MSEILSLVLSTKFADYIEFHEWIFKFCDFILVKFHVRNLFFWVKFYPLLWVRNLLTTLSFMSESSSWVKFQGWNSQFLFYQESDLFISCDVLDVSPHKIFLSDLIFSEILWVQSLMRFFWSKMIRRQKIWRSFFMVLLDSIKGKLPSSHWASTALDFYPYCRTMFGLEIFVKWNYKNL